MKLDRETNPDGRGKYALIKLRSAQPAIVDSEVLPDGTSKPLFYEIAADAVDFGDTDDTEFFVIRLKDRNAVYALIAYAQSCRSTDPEFADSVLNLAMKCNRIDRTDPS